MEIHGTTSADMNGKRGVATDYHFDREGPSKWRYTVQLDAGEAVKVKPANVRAEHTSAEEKLFESALQVVSKINNAVDPSNTLDSWPPLSMSQQKEMDGAIVMMQEAMDKVSGRVRDSMVSGAARAHHFAQPHPFSFRVTFLQLRPSATRTTGVKAWRSTTRGRWRRTRSVPSGVTLGASIRSGSCTVMATASLWTTSTDGN